MPYSMDSMLSDHRARERVGAVVVAAGQSSRMTGLDKVFATVAGLPLVAHSICALEGSEAVDQIVLVLSAARLDEGRALVRCQGWHKVVAVCAGGDRRQDSVRVGLEHLDDCHWVVVHDGARPCVTPALVAQGVDAAQETGAAVAAVPSKDTIKVVSESGFVESTPDRNKLWSVQTPQTFRYDVLMSAHQQLQASFTDDAAMVEALGGRVKVHLGSYENLKVTTPEDLPIVEQWLSARVAAAPQTASPSSENRA